MLLTKVSHGLPRDRKFGPHFEDACVLDPRYPARKFLRCIHAPHVVAPRAQELVKLAPARPHSLLAAMHVLSPAFEDDSNDRDVDRLALQTSSCCLARTRGPAIK